ncbi:N-6 DNA methylase, partial [Nocardia sp. NPDC059764]|uniref:N-6 DNA methylase n=1 Tax=Nocardia sp. NPDC059764 TaxID=3346939 RepID=UPI00365E2D6B
MSKPVSTVSAAEISRLAGVTRATVSNWRRRHADFPKSTGGSEARPQFDLGEVQRWLAEHGNEASASAVSELRSLVRTRATPDTVARLLQALRRGKSGWTAPGFDAELGDEVTRLLGRAAAEAGARMAIDILCERALEETAATGVYITPAWLADLMAALTTASGPEAEAEVESAHTVLDPACGSGSLLLAAARTGASQLAGQDALPVQVQRARLLIEAETALEPDMRTGDSLTADAFPDLRVDAVVCNPPYGQRDWGASELAFDPRWDYGLPPRGEPELAWVQHALAHLRPGGTAVVLLPPAVATRPSGRKIRANLVRTGALRSVIGLAPGSAQPWHVGLQIWLLRRPRPAVPVADSMLFVDTTGVPAAGDGENIAVTDTVLRAWRAFDGPDPDSATESGVAVGVRLVDVLTEEVDLTPAGYVRSALDSGTVSDQVGEAIRSLSDTAADLTSAAGDMCGWSAGSGVSWRYVTIADLANHGQLELIRSILPGGESAESAGRAPAEEPDTGSVPDLNPVVSQRRMLIAPDIATGVPASGTATASVAATSVEVRAGDVLIPAVRSDRTGGRSARVADAADAGVIRGPHIHTLRVDLDRLDPWFLAGFLTGAENISATRTSTVRFDPSRLRVPVLGLAEQQRYGELFRQLFTLRTAARRATEAAEQVAELVTTGL